MSDEKELYDEPPDVCRDCWAYCNNCQCGENELRAETEEAEKKLDELKATVREYFDVESELSFKQTRGLRILLSQIRSKMWELSAPTLESHPVELASKFDPQSRSNCRESEET